MSSADPLVLLRGALSSGQPISLLAADGTEVFGLKDCADISFGAGRTFPKTTPTRFLSDPASSVDDPAAPTYDLQTLLFAFNEKDTATGSYFRNANIGGVTPVTATDRKIVVDYLRGSGPAEGPENRVRPLAGAAKRAADGEAGEAAAGAGGAAPPQKKQRYVPNREDQEKVKRMLAIIEGPQYGHVVGPNETKLEKTGGAYHNRETVLRGERINNFESVRALVAPRLKQLKEDPTRKQAQQQVAPVQKIPQKKKQMNPIIMISPSSTALITMHNVKQFLEEARFVPSEEARRLAAAENLAGNAPVEDVVLVNHARASASTAPGAEVRKARYFVVDSVEALSKFGGGKLDEAWERVVCVMTTGQEWQFKPYKWKDPKELFHHVKGVYPQWTIDAPNAKVKSWNVSELRIDPTKRHTDKSTVADFWRMLEGWIAVNKPWVTY